MNEAERQLRLDILPIGGRISIEALDKNPEFYYNCYTLEVDISESFLIITGYKPILDDEQFNIVLPVLEKSMEDADFKINLYTATFPALVFFFLLQSLIYSHDKQTNGKSSKVLEAVGVTPANPYYKSLEFIDMNTFGIVASLFAGFLVFCISKANQQYNRLDNIEKIAKTLD